MLKGVVLLSIIYVTLLVVRALKSSTGRSHKTEIVRYENYIVDDTGLVSMYKKKKIDIQV